MPRTEAIKDIVVRLIPAAILDAILISEKRKWVGSSHPAKI